MYRGPRCITAWRAGAVSALASFGVGAADVQVSGGSWVRSIGAAQLQAGAGSELASPVLEGESVTVLSISGADGADWIVQVALVGNPLTWPPGAVLELRRVGGTSEAGITDGLGYQAVTPESQMFFSGSGNYPEVEILVRLSGFGIDTEPGDYTVGIQFHIELT